MPTPKKAAPKAKKAAPVVAAPAPKNGKAVAAKKKK
jgi:hypothetical protein